MRELSSGVIAMVELSQCKWLGCHLAQTREGYLFLFCVRRDTIDVCDAVAMTTSDANGRVKLFAQCGWPMAPLQLAPSEGVTSPMAMHYNMDSGPCYTPVEPA